MTNNSKRVYTYGAQHAAAVIAVLGFTVTELNAQPLLPPYRKSIIRLDRTWRAPVAGFPSANAPRVRFKPTACLRDLRFSIAHAILPSEGPVRASREQSCRF